jgi:ABC-type polysaccharide/polyol phosphate export permease
VLAELYAYRELVRNLHGTKPKYRDSLRASWVTLNPLMLLAVYSVVFHIFRVPLENSRCTSSSAFSLTFFAGSVQSSTGR